MTGLARLDAPTRLAGVDLARGLAVLGMFGAHFLVTRDFDVADPSTWTDVVNGRSSILFATLAGVSIGLITGGARPVRGSGLRLAAGRLAVRAVALWLLGVLLIGLATPAYIILPAYGLLLLAALPFLTLRARVVLPVAVAVGLVTPFLLHPVERLVAPALDQDTQTWLVLGWEYPALVWITFVLAGLGLARADLRSIRTQLVALVAGTLLAVVGYGAGAAAEAAGAGDELSVRPHSAGVFEVIGSGGVAVAVIGLCCLICRGVVARALLPLRAVGSMPLSVYSAQIVAWWAVAVVAFGSVRDPGVYSLDLFWPLTVGAIVVATLWALLVGRGPLEWAIDRLAAVVVPSPDPQPARERIDA